MKIAVCVKQVMSPEATVRVDVPGTWVREDAATWVLNEPDAYALEEALKLKDAQGAEVVAISAGPARVAAVLRECLARGADRAIHIEGAFPPGNSAAVAAALATGLAEGGIDLVLTGLQSIDTGSAQVGVILAERLGMAHVTIATAINVEGAAVTVTRELEAGWFQQIAVPFPAVVTVQSGINQLRYATLKGIMAAKKKELRTIPALPSTPGPRVTKVYPPTGDRGTRMLGGTPAQAARELVRILKEDERVL
jgi:electron transfer flavoprotein beta subunit